MFFARRFRTFRKIIFHPARHPFSDRFVADDRSRARTEARASRATTKSIVVQNAANRIRDASPTMWLQAASLLGLRDSEWSVRLVMRDFRRICV